MSTQSIGFGDAKFDTEGKGMKAIEKYFSPEFRNRLDGIITFNSLSQDIMEMVVDKFIAELNEQLSVKKVALTISPAVRAWLAKKGHDPRYGARPLARVIQTDIKDMLSDEILFGKLSSGGHVHIDVKDDKLDFSFS